MLLVFDHQVIFPLSGLLQWANSLFQGANLPLPVPLKVGILRTIFFFHDILATRNIHMLKAF